MIAAAIVLFMLVEGDLRPAASTCSSNRPAPSLHQSQSGGFLDPIVGTLVVTAIGIVIAAPAGVGIAVWLVEYARPRWLARAVESGIETIAGVPSIVLALFGLLVFARAFFAFLSAAPATARSLGQSFLSRGSSWRCSRCR